MTVKLKLVTLDCHLETHDRCNRLIDTEYGFMSCGCKCHMNN